MWLSRHDVIIIVQYWAIAINDGYSRFGCTFSQQLQLKIQFHMVCGKLLVNPAQTLHPKLWKSGIGPGFLQMSLAKSHENYAIGYGATVVQDKLCSKYCVSCILAFCRLVICDSICCWSCNKDTARTVECPDNQIPFPLTNPWPLLKESRDLHRALISHLWQSVQNNTMINDIKSCWEVKKDQ